MNAAPAGTRYLADLQARWRAGDRPKFLCFWGHTHRTDELGPWCLSQWAETPFELDGVRYRTAEHYMMAEKARLFGDAARLAEIVASSTPGAAKAAGRGVVGFDEARWVEHRFDIVVRGNVAKFGATRELRTWLVGTAPRVLVEASPRDRVWGIGRVATDPAAVDPTQWRGLNLLGFALMEARRQLVELG